MSTGSLSLAEVAAKLDAETLRRLKRECGGLQTLLRNSHQVFEGKGLSLCFLFFFIFERQCVHTSERGRERGRESYAGSTLSEESLRQGSISQPAPKSRV